MCVKRKRETDGTFLLYDVYTKLKAVTLKDSDREIQIRLFGMLYRIDPKNVFFLLSYQELCNLE